jgi:hypothetical protein
MASGMARIPQMQTLLYGAAALHRLVPAEGAESVGVNDLGADTVEFSGKRRVCTALLKIDDHSLGGVLRTRAHADADLFRAIGDYSCWS